ncbi:MAG: DNA repair exonuclease [Gemmatimonadota bacterium]
MSTIRFIHTADWHIGAPFHRVTDPDHRARVRLERQSAIGRMREAVREFEASFVLVAGDLFHSSSPSPSEVSQALSHMGALGVPVMVIPGNHDHGGAGGIWSRKELKEQLAKAAPNVRVLLERAPMEVAGAVVLPCPLLARGSSADPAGWIRSLDFASLPPGPRIVLAHGSVQGFGGETAAEADDENPSAGSSHINLASLPMDEVDYVALGDWHGAKEVGPKAWYPGTPETDRFPRGEGYRSGQVLCVEASRGGVPTTEFRRTGALQWHVVDHRFNTDEDLQLLQARVDGLLEGRAGMDLLLLKLDGSLSLDAAGRLESWLQGLEARLLRLKLRDRTSVAPNEDELRELTQRAGDPLVARVAARLEEKMDASGRDGEVARMALRELYATCVQREG